MLFVPSASTSDTESTVRPIACVSASFSLRQGHEQELSAAPGYEQPIWPEHRDRLHHRQRGVDAAEPNLLIDRRHDELRARAGGRIARVQATGQHQVGGKACEPSM